MNNYNPTMVFHPGETLDEKLHELEMGPKEFAIRTGKPEKTIIAILKGDSSITPDMAVQFENVLQIPANFWLNFQRSYDEFLAREKRVEVYEDAIDWAKNFPIAEMIKNNWLPKVTTWEDKAAALLSFFGISNKKAWEDYYIKQELKVAFRISLAHSNQPHAISAWLREGEIKASEIKSKPYSETDFKKALPEIKTVMAKHPANFFKQLQDICQDAGVKVVFTPCLPKAPIHGATRWIKDTPLIQLTGRYNRNDTFWFTFFHETGHIILHGKKDVFLEKVDYTDKDNKKEKEADDFAVKWTLTKDEEKEIIESLQAKKGDLTSFAKKFNTHPAIIIGRLQHEKLISHSVGHQFIKAINLS